MLSIHDRGYPLAPARTAIEIVCVAAGWALGGQIGAGTVVAAVAIGPILRWTLSATGYGTAKPGEKAAELTAHGASLHSRLTSRDRGQGGREGESHHPAQPAPARTPTPPT